MIFGIFSDKIIFGQIICEDHFCSLVSLGAFDRLEGAEKAQNLFPDH